MSPDQPEEVGDRFRPNAELGDHRLLVDQLALAPVELDHTPVLDALAEVLVRRHDHHLLDPVVGIGHGGGGAERVVGLPLDHRPRRHTHRLERALHDRDLPEQLGRHARARLVARPEVVAERLDDVVAGDTDVGRTLLEQLQCGGEDTDGGVERAGVTRRVAAAPHASEVLAEQLVRSVDEVDLHPPNRTARVSSVSEGAPSTRR